MYGPNGYQVVYKSDHIVQCHMLVSCQIDTLGASKITSGMMMSRNNRLTLDCVVMVDLAVCISVQLNYVHQRSNA